MTKPKPWILLMGTCLGLGLPVPAARAAVANGGFEECSTATQAPNRAWTLRGGLLPAGWQFNATYGGQVEIVGDCHAGKRALRLEGSSAHIFQPPAAVKSGDVFQVSAWVKGGGAELTFYEYAGDRFVRTAPAVAVVAAGDAWAQGGGYYHVGSAQVTMVAFAVVGTGPGSVLVDDVEVKPLPPSEARGEDVVLENRGCRLTLDAGGRAKGFFDKTLGEERASAGAPPFFGAALGNWRLPVTRAVRQGDLLKLTFGADQAHAAVEVKEEPYYLGLGLKAWDPPEVAAVTLLDLTVARLRTVGGLAGIAYDDKAAEGLQTLHYAGSQEVTACDRTVTFRCAFPAARGLDKARCAFLACPRPRLEQTIGEIEQAYGLPSPKILGVRGKASPLMKRSYFFVHDLSEANVNDAIAWGKRGHFGYILILEDAWSHGGGTFAINEKNFPNGIAGLKTAVGRLQAEGFKVGLHFLTAGLRGTDPLVSPKPSDGLHYASEIPLSGDVDEKSDFLPTAVPPRGFPDKDGGYEGSGTYLRVGDEIVQYRTLKLDPPCGFAGCQRGALKSAPSAHPAGARARHMKRAFGLFMIDADSPLMDRVGENLARAFDACGGDGLYFDGSECLQGDHSYYNARVQMAYAGRIPRRDIICQGSSYSFYTWHLISRMSSADGYRDVKGYLDRRSRGFADWDANLMPLDIGWYGLNSEIRPDDIEYVCSRALGFDASMSLSTSIQNLKAVPQAGQIVDSIALWEDLRLSGKVPEDVRARLREPGREYRLEIRDGRAALIPIRYSAWTAAGREPGEQRVGNDRDKPARLQLELECGRAKGRGQDPLINPRILVGGQTIEFKATMSTGDRLVYRGPDDCRLHRPGKDPEAVKSDGTPPAVKDSVTVQVPPTTHELRFRTALTWPDLAVTVPR